MRKVLFLFALVVSLVGYSQSQQSPSTPVSNLQSTSISGPFLIRDNEVWVQAGDSITWQALYTTYLEAFIRARYPNLKFVTVNSGKSGEVTIQGIVRFRNSIAAFKPTLVTSAYGMNDHVKVFAPGANFVDDPRSPPQRFADEVKRIGARYAIISASPLLQPMEDESTFTATDGSIVPPKERTNWVNKEFADQVKAIAERNGVPYLDQMTPLQTIWGAHYERDNVAALASLLERFQAEQNAPPTGAAAFFALDKLFKDQAVLQKLALPDGARLVATWRSWRDKKIATEALNEFLDVWLQNVGNSQPSFVRLSGYTNSSRHNDLIHPNEAGHLHMAGVLFKLMGGDGLVSAASLDGKTGKVLDARKTTIRETSVKNGVLSFRRLDESLPLPIDALARPAIDVDVSTPMGTPKDLFDMSRYLLAVSNLARGNYEIVVDNEVIATASSEELARGIDLGLMSSGPIFRQTQELLQAVRAGIIMALPEKGAEPPSTDVAPKILPEAQPVERAWVIRPVK